MWLPFFLMRRLHFGQVPIPFSSTNVVPRDAACWRIIHERGDGAGARRSTSHASPVARSDRSGGTGASVKDDCVFCRIVARRTPADIEYEDDAILVFKDIYP